MCNKNVYVFNVSGFNVTRLKKPLQSSSHKNSARVGGQDREKPPAHRTNQIAGFGEFRPLTWKKIKNVILVSGKFTCFLAIDILYI